MSLPEAVAVQNELQAKGNEYQKQLEDMQKELQTKAEAYDKAKATMPTAKQEETERELNEYVPEDSADRPGTTRRPSTTSSSVSSDRCSTRFARLLHLLLRRVVTSISWRSDGGQPLYINDTISKDITVEVKGRACQDEVSRRRIDPLCSQGQIDIGSVCP